MQIFQRLFKVVQDKQAINPNIANKKDHAEDKKEIIPSNNRRTDKKPKKRERIDLDCKDLNKHLASLVGRQNFQACFSNSLYIYKVKIKKDEIVRGLARNDHNNPGYSDQQASNSSLATTHNVGNKVLPVNDTSRTSSNRRRKKNGNEGVEKPKAMSKMKELLRWSTTAKSLKDGKHNGIKDSHFRGVKGLPSGHDLISDSPKISFSLSRESCSTVKSIQCHNHCVHENGNWITTDDEFVVLEL